MRTQELIQALSDDLRPVSPLNGDRDLAFGLIVGAAAALLLLVGGLGGHLDIDRAARGWPLWMKWLYTAPLCAGGFVAVRGLSRPANAPPAMIRFALLPLAPLAYLALFELSREPASHWPSLWMGQSWRDCAGRILLLAIPVFIALTWQVRQAAPTRLRLAGAAVGLASGAAAATLYALGCAETSACFVIVWYSLGIGLSGAAGALLGPFLLWW